MFVSDLSVSYFCHKCNWRTSGVILDGVNEDLRQCIKCNSQLLQCPTCSNFTSVTSTEDVSVCDQCHSSIIKNDKV